MITIVLTTGFKIKYKGKVYLTLTENSLAIDAQWVVRDDDNFPVSDGHTWDLFERKHIKEIISE